MPKGKTKTLDSTSSWTERIGLSQSKSMDGQKSIGTIFCGKCCYSSDSQSCKDCFERHLCWYPSYLPSTSIITRSSTHHHDPSRTSIATAIISSTVQNISIHGWHMRICCCGPHILLDHIWSWRTWEIFQRGSEWPSTLVFQPIRPTKNNFWLVWKNWHPQSRYWIALWCCWLWQPCIV